MVFGAIFAGGSGNRMNSDIPKQYLPLGGKPVIVHTVCRFAQSGLFDRLFVLCPEAWLEKTAEMLSQEIPSERIDVISGGSTRNETLKRAIEYVRAAAPGDDDAVLVTHDAVRPFVTKRMLEENISFTLRFGGCDTVVPATDTIVRSTDGEFITDIPVRGEIFQGQTPQSFLVGKLESLLCSLTEEEEARLTDACSIFALRGETVALVRGETSNIKITYADDLKIAEALLKNGA